jgi:hypothetical protein
MNSASQGSRLKSAACGDFDLIEKARRRQAFRVATENVFSHPMDRFG